MKFIKKSIELESYNYFSKDALMILIDITERIAKQDFANPLELLTLIYFYVIKFLFNIVDNNKNNENDKNFVEIFESKKICVKFFINCISSIEAIEDNEMKSIDESENEYILRLSKEVDETDTLSHLINTESYGFKNNSVYSLSKNQEIKVFKESLKNDLIRLIKKSYKSHRDPFYFKFIFFLFCQTNEHKLIIDLTITIIDLILEENINEDTPTANMGPIWANTKNLVVLIYRMLFINRSSNKEIFTTKNFEDKICNFLLNILSNQIIYTKTTFNIYAGKKLYNDTEGKQRTILDMLFDIFLELYSLTKDENYLRILEENLILTSKTSKNHEHTIFYYMDLYNSFQHIRI